jgi:hypothetical protein
VVNLTMFLIMTENQKNARKKISPEATNRAKRENNRTKFCLELFKLQSFFN